MTRSIRVSLATTILLGAATGLSATVHAQQFGPPQQSLYAHNPGSAPTYVNYNQNQYIPSVPAAPASPNAKVSAATPLRHTPTTHAGTAAHPITLRKKSAPTSQTIY